MSVSSQKKLMVLLTSLDGNHKHPFEADETVGDAHEYAYKKLVRQKDQIPLERTWMEYDGSKREDSERLGDLVQQPQGGSEPDLTLALAWDFAGGRG